jgi:DNA-directed RNA polymerase
MNEKKPESIPFITPFGTLRYPKISQPDTKGKYADGKFKTDIVFSDDDFVIVEETIREAVAKLLPAAKNPRLPLFTEWEEGRGIRLKCTYRPAVFDAKNKKLPEDMLLVGGGTIARIAATIFAYEMAGNSGIDVRLGKIQVKKLVEYQGGDASPFDDTEGFTIA